ncbi:MAG: radical SAM protein [Vampirovibrionales bacterium]|nr:radical SAM protein [Vampirovibrionales bacterium]
MSLSLPTVSSPADCNGADGLKNTSLHERARHELDNLLSLVHLPLEQRRDALGVDLSRYSALSEREVSAPIRSRKNREMRWALLRTYGAKLLGRIPNPVMMTHIVTTRCNYACSFCSFADTLNAKTNELSLAEIEKTYATLGNSMNVIVYSGGETTLNRHLPEIIEAAYRLTPVQSVYIISNAWKPQLLFQITHRIMQSCPGLHLTWSLSIEGPPSINNKERTTKAKGWNAWQNTIDAMVGLQQMREEFDYELLDVQLCTVCTPDNHALLPDWYAVVRDVLRPDKWNLNLMRRSVQMANSPLASFSARRRSATLEPFEATYQAITQQVREDVISGRLQFLYHTATPADGAMKSAVDLLSQEENRRMMSSQKPAFCCQAGSVGAYISSEGSVSGCEEFAHNPQEEKAFGHLRDYNYDFQALWHSDRAQAMRTLVGKSSECFGCSLESQRNYPSILVSLNTLLKARGLASKIENQAV